jgi:hypothetical protein
MSKSVMSWIGWHIGELAGVIVPGVIALTITRWAAVVSAVVAASWVVHEVRSARRGRVISTRPTLEAGRSDEDTSGSVVGWGDAR